jgi:2'-5' RNA ligase
MHEAPDSVLQQLPEMLRLFVAVPATPAVAARALETVEALRGRGDVRWVTGDRLHLTLKFLGAVPREKLPSIRRSLAKNANNFSPFMVELEGVGAFPHLRHPRTVWMGVEGATAAFAALARETDRALHLLGFPLEQRPFQAHLTIGRVKSPKGLKELGESLHDLAASQRRREGNPAWAIEEYHLIHSDLHPGGPRYTLLNRFPFRREQPPDQDSATSNMDRERAG